MCQHLLLVRVGYSDLYTYQCQRCDLVFNASRLDWHGTLRPLARKQHFIQCFICEPSEMVARSDYRAHVEHHKMTCLE